MPARQVKIKPDPSTSESGRESLTDTRSSLRATDWLFSNSRPERCLPFDGNYSHRAKKHSSGKKQGQRHELVEDT